jgi:hypothetical protein
MGLLNVRTNLQRSLQLLNICFSTENHLGSISPTYVSQAKSCWHSPFNFTNKIKAKFVCWNSPNTVCHSQNLCSKKKLLILLAQKSQANMLVKSTPALFVAHGTFLIKKIVIAYKNLKQLIKIYLGSYRNITRGQNMSIFIQKGLKYCSQQ